MRFRNWLKDFYKHRYHILIALVLLVISGASQALSGAYTIKASVSTVGDIILDNMPPVNLSFIFVYGFVALLIIILIYSIYNIKLFAYIISQTSLLTLVRSGFITLTHLKTPAEAIPVIFHWPLSLLASQNDLFFSGHTAAPFMAFLVLKGYKIRYFFLAASLLMALTVLLMHQHYSIDVLAAYFITYGTYKIGNVIFKKFREEKK